jgi:hypothetical protein
VNELIIYRKFSLRRYLSTLACYNHQECVTHGAVVEIDVEEVSNEKDLELLNRLNIDSDSEDDVPLNVLRMDDSIYDDTSDDDIVELPEGDPNCMCCIILMFYLPLICYIYITVDTNFDGQQILRTMMLRKKGRSIMLEECCVMLSSKRSHKCTMKRI